ncbi:MAG: HPP family protein [Saprospiraceae bacterium]
MYTEEIKTKKVSDLMSRNILVGHVTNSFTHTLRIFAELIFHHLPIVNSKREVIGMISSNDMLKSLTMKLPMLKQSDEETLNMMFDIRELMTRDPQVISSGASVSEALSIFSKHHIHALPVVDENELVGIITSNDVLAALSK